MSLFKKPILNADRIKSLAGFLILIGCLIYAAFHYTEAKEFLGVLVHADPKLIVLVIVLQVATDVFAGAVIYELVRFSRQHVSLIRLARLSLERMTVNQLVPAAGFSGHVFLYSTLRHLGVSRGVATEAIFIDTLSYYFGYIGATLAAIAIVFAIHQQNLLLISLLVIFLAISFGIVGGIFWIFSQKDRRLPAWMHRFTFVTKISDSMQQASPDHILNLRLLAITATYGFLVFVFDGAILWVIMKMIGIPLDPFTTFAVFVIASIVGSLSLLPGGVGGFEAASILALRYVNVPLGAALTATLLLRGITIWLPLIPGSLFAAKHAVRDSEDDD